MEINKDGLRYLRGPKQFGGYLIIKNPTPEVSQLLEAMREFKFNEGEISFRMICKPAQHFDFDESDDLYASVGWKLGLVDKTSTLEDRVKEIQ